MLQLFALALALAPAADAAPARLTWQGRLLDASGAPLGAAPVALRLDLYADETGASVWDDTFTVSPNDGFVTVVLGSGQALDLGDFATGEVWAQASVGGSALTPRQQLLSVPFALVAGGVVAGPPPTGACEAGQLRWDTTAEALRVCDGSIWRYLGARTLVLDGGARRYDDGTTARSCWHYLNPDAGALYLGATGTGLYWIDPDQSGSNAPFQVWCDMGARHPMNLDYPDTRSVG